MNEEEKKVINIFIEKCNKYDESVEIKGISVGEEYRMLDTVCKALNLIEKLQEHNKKYKEFFDLMLILDSDYFMNCGDEETNKLVDEILKLESE